MYYVDTFGGILFEGDFGNTVSILATYSVNILDFHEIMYFSKQTARGYEMGNLGLHQKRYSFKAKGQNYLIY
jgi:5-bromo-4-chloroindolyl phosphate hydrolysis protein